ncbi:MAG TPA: hypothetical protein VEN30_13425 [Paraburkholderia sp.]|nr:hypothetical protein [Paraburkholderia sp.]
MATLSPTVVWDGLRHPVRSLRKQLSKSASIASDQSLGERPAAGHAAQSAERLERIAAYARVGYFHMEYTAGMFVVPFDAPPE